MIILGDPEAVSHEGEKVWHKQGQKSPWLLTITRPFPNVQVNGGPWLVTKYALYYFDQSANSIFWVLFVCLYMRDFTKISSCRVNTRSTRGIKQLGISFGFIFLLFSYESS